MALDGFYSFEITGNDGSSIEAKIVLNPAHEIFTGHFPGTPVVPGVCQVEMVKSIFSNALGKSASLAEAKEIKYLSMILPGSMQELACTITYANEGDNRYKIAAQISHADKVCMKTKASFIV